MVKMAVVVLLMLMQLRNFPEKENAKGTLTMKMGTACPFLPRVHFISFSTKTHILKSHASSFLSFPPRSTSPFLIYLDFSSSSSTFPHSRRRNCEKAPFRVHPFPLYHHSSFHMHCSLPFRPTHSPSLHSLLWFSSYFSPLILFERRVFEVGFKGTTVYRVIPIWVFHYALNLRFQVVLFATMVHLLFTVLFAEVALVLLLMVKSPLRKLAIAGLDQIKQGRGPVIVKTLCGIVFVLLISSVDSIVKIQNRLFNFGATEPTDHILMGRHLLEASLMGCSIFLMIVVDRLHYYIRELRGMRKTIEYSKKQVVVFREEAKKLLEDEIISLRARVKQLELESKGWEREAKNAEANAEALRKQSEGFLLEYDRLLEDNQSLRNQLQLIDCRLSRSNSRKNS